ncbi:uncharacterized protein BDV14DRAFT_194915 [Aspergillus stella-maris]|uniref:uncharacterized protein n=1 Tax=Aspergillus stella-maris TaxID=1810926 RepID=UPI003CCDCB07
MSMTYEDSLNSAPPRPPPKIPTHVLDQFLLKDKKGIWKNRIFLANAGISIPKPLLEQSLAEYHAQMAVNVRGVIHSAKIIGPIFKDQGFGNFIITGSREYKRARRDRSA